MSLSKALGTLTTPGSTGNQAITGLGFQPKMVIFFKLGATNNTALWPLGVAVSSTQRWCAAVADYDGLATAETARAFRSDACIISLATGDTINRQADFVSMDADGFTINWSVASAGQDVNWLALGGSDISAAAGTFDLASGTGNQSVTGVGFVPKALLFSNTISNTTEGVTAYGVFNMGVAVSTSQRWALGFYSEDAAPISDTSSALLTDACLIRQGLSSITVQADFVSHDADGFTINKSAAPGSSVRHGWLALGGNALFAAGAFNQPGSTGNQAITGVGFEPVVEIFAGQGKTSGGTVTAHARNMLGVAISSSSQAVGFDSCEDNVTTSNTSRYRSTASCIAHTADGGSTVTTAAVMVSQDADGFTVNWTAADATARQIVYLAIGAAPAAATATYISGPARGMNGAASTNFTAGALGPITGTVTVTPTDGGAGGTFAPTSAAISSGTPTATFTYTPATPGTITISAANDGGLTAGTASYKSDTLNYYISVAGSDSATGATTGAPWATASQILTWGWVRGATYHFNGGDTFVTELPLEDGVSGVLAESLITIKSYGTGKAILARTGSSTATPIKVRNCGGFKLENVKVVGAGNTPGTSTQSGIWFDWDSAASSTVYNLTVTNCEIYNLKRGLWARGTTANAVKASTVTVTNNLIYNTWHRPINVGQIPDAAANGYDGVLGLTISGNTIHSCDDSGQAEITGIVVAYSTGTVVSGNLVHDLGGLGTGNGMYGWGKNDGLIFRDNEVYNIRRGSTTVGDAVGINLDSGSVNSYVEYNYVHDCEGGGLVCYAYLSGTIPAGVGAWDNNTFRYNVVQDCATEHMGAFWVLGDSLTNCYVYNNTFVQTSSAANTAMAGYDSVAYAATLVSGFRFYNNVFYAASNSVKFASMPGASGSAANTYFSNNTFFPFTGSLQVAWFGTSYSTLAAWDAAASTVSGNLSSDPALVAPTTEVIYDDPTRISSFGNVTPTSAASPVVNAGLDLTASPYSYTGITRDFAGNPPLAGAGYDIGAIEFGSSSGAFLVSARRNQSGINFFGSRR